MKVPYFPTVASLISLFHRRGSKSQFIEFSEENSVLNQDNFGCMLNPTESPVLKILSTASSAACWLTTERIIWERGGNRQELLLKQLVDAEPADFGQIPVENSVVLKVETRDGQSFVIDMPDSGILNGMWGLMDRCAKRNLGAERLLDCISSRWRGPRISCPYPATQTRTIYLVA